MRLFPTIFLCVSLVCAGAWAQAPLVSIVAPDDGLAFVELHNQSDATVDLTGYHLATTPEFYRIADWSLDDGPDGWVLAFPDGFLLPAGKAVVLLSGTVDDFVAAYGFAPEAVVGTQSLGAQAMVPIHGTAASPAAAADLVALFYWNGSSDLVQDADLVFWGEGPRVDRNGVLVDGEDDGLEASPYPPETAAADQLPAAPPADGEALVRDGDEGEETRGGIGLDGTDETSEDLGAAFVSAVAAPDPQVTYAGVAMADMPVTGTLVFGRDEDVFEAPVVDGLFAIEVPAAAQLTVSIVLGQSTYVGGVTTGVGSEREAVVLLATSGSFTISGTVAADPIAPGDLDAVAIVVEESGQTVEVTDGAFAVTVAAAGSYTLVVSGEEIRDARVVVEVVDADVDGVEILVAAAHSLSGTVVGGDTGKPVEGAVVAIDGAEVPTDAAGAWEVTQLAPGTYDVTVLSDGYEPFATSVELASSQVLQVTLVPVARYALTVTVEDAGSPLAGASVTVRGGELAGGSTVETGADGVASFSGLRAGNYTVMASAAGYDDVTIETIPVRADAALVVSLVPDTREPTVRTGTKCDCSTPHAPVTPLGGAAMFLLLGLVAVVRGSSRR